MPAPKKTSKTDRYLDVARESRQYGETNDCTVKAVAITTGASYEDAHWALAEFGRKNGHGAQISQTVGALGLLGCTARRVRIGEIIDSYPKPHCNVLKNITTHHPDRFASVWPAGAYLLFTAGHVAAVVDGENHDWTRGSAKRVEEMFIVEAN